MAEPGFYAEIKFFSDPATGQQVRKLIGGVHRLGDRSGWSPDLSVRRSA
jgi:hypothetical protein